MNCNDKLYNYSRIRSCKIELNIIRLNIITLWKVDEIVPKSDIFSRGNLSKLGDSFFFLKKRKILVRETVQKKKKLNATYLMLSVFSIIIQKFLYTSCWLPIKIYLKEVFLGTTQSHWDLSTPEDYFLSLVIWLRFMVKAQTSDIQMTYEHIRVTYEWHTSTYEWHTNDIQVDTSDIQMPYERIRLTYEYIRVTYEWHASDMRIASTKSRRISPVSFYGKLPDYYSHVFVLYT